jgi:hypothetical protein
MALDPLDVLVRRAIVIYECKLVAEPVMTMIRDPMKMCDLVTRDCL